MIQRFPLRLIFFLTFHEASVNLEEIFHAFQCPDYDTIFLLLNWFCSYLFMKLHEVAKNWSKETLCVRPYSCSEWSRTFECQGLSCLEFCSFIVRFKEHQEMKYICEWVWPFFKCSQCDNNFRLFSFLTQKLELKSGFCFASLHPFSCSSFRKIGISVHPDISRSILVRPGSENHSGSEGWR